ncbi:MAG: UdgX family uracil-DNA binding protein [Acidobacteriaceae bacterium]|nr:UdgX family uracil-DNA binding protein [Acidobacteriaceae bacterium]
MLETYDDWRAFASPLLGSKTPPREVYWESDQQAPLFRVRSQAPDGPAVMIPKVFVALARTVARHSNPDRWRMLYRVAWRITNGERNLLEVDVDDDVAALRHMARAVDKDIYRMRQFVRFRKAGEERFIAWYEPEHNTLDANGSFFVDRFGSMRWAILTPRASLAWDLDRLESGPGVPRSHAPQDDELEELWRVYYGAIFNPARLKLRAMQAQLPLSRWKNLPEARAIPSLARLSQGRVQQMVEAQPRSALDFIPLNSSWSELRDAIRNCSACDLCRRGNGPVWGEGDLLAQVMIVGEQPGDEEDLAGRPFVGPAGQVLDRALAQAGIERQRVYLTNAVKAFKFEERGKRRIHQNPRSGEISTCRPWLRAEIEAVRPARIICLGSSAAQSVLGRKVQIAKERGHWAASGGRRVLVTYHPSAILRNPDPARQQQLYSMLVTDLSQARVDLNGGSVAEGR